MAVATAPTCLGKVGNLFNCLQVTFLDCPPDLKVGDAKALADNLTLGHWDGHAAIIGNGGFQGLPAHYRTMHLFLGQTTQILGNILIGNIFSLCNG